ncbi:hypothetical protein SAMD00023353_0403750 [Rosellinia necatrix]|uniref:Uncharacterized protein n=1 Tax=Rosellinia necatrix TaxID=77044 RepID=A0A1W2TWC3_ROSNE|nr:hypothetical protein SAMD00023353_0403750 [Rosellinia necatrix]
MSLGRKKHYFLPEIPEVPVDGPIQLGSIISDPRFVFEPINSPPVNPVSCLENVYVFNSGPSSIALAKSRKKSIGIFGELPGLLNANLNTEFGTDAGEHWSFDNLRTIWFVPSVEYVRQSLLDISVQLYIQTNQSWLGHTSLYMVTGVKVAFGASALSDFATSYGFGGSIGLDPAVLGVPITVGPTVELWNGLSNSATSSPTQPVVFAFRLRKLKIKARSGGVKQSDYNKNGLLGEEDAPIQPTVEIDTDGVEDYDATGADFDLPDEADTVDEIDEDECEGTSFSKFG